jgi:hypothetical protein
MAIWHSFIAKKSNDDLAIILLLNTCWRFGVILLLNARWQFCDSLSLNIRWQFWQPLIA